MRRGHHGLSHLAHLEAAALEDGGVHVKGQRLRQRLRRILAIFLGKDGAVRGSLSKRRPQLVPRFEGPQTLEDVLFEVPLDLRKGKAEAKRR